MLPALSTMKEHTARSLRKIACLMTLCAGACGDEGNIGYLRQPVCSGADISCEVPDTSAHITITDLKEYPLADLPALAPTWVKPHPQAPMAASTLVSGANS